MFYLRILVYLCRMLTEEENNFILYWQDNRLRKKKVWKQLSVGMPLGAALGGAIMINIFSGWNKAGTVLQFDPQLMAVVLIAVLMIVIFIVIFSARHRWDLNEQHYRELLAKKQKE